MVSDKFLHCISSETEFQKFAHYAATSIRRDGSWDCLDSITSIQSSIASLRKDTLSNPAIFATLPEDIFPIHRALLLQESLLLQ